MVLLYIFIGFLLASIGAAPLGASNIAVVTTTTKKSLSRASNIIYGAGFGEVLLAFLSLWYSKMLSDYFTMNPWIQISFIFLFFIIGIYFLLPKKPKIALKHPPKAPSKFLTGFFLALANPPVLVYWILAISLVQKYIMTLSDMSPINVLIFFFTGVFIGKVWVLFMYGKLSKRFQKRNNDDNNTSSKLHRYIGVGLVVLSIVQGIRFAIS